MKISFKFGGKPLLETFRNFDSVDSLTHLASGDRAENVHLSRKRKIGMLDRCQSQTVVRNCRLNRAIGCVAIAVVHSQLQFAVIVFHIYY